jgi:hypothetical protein
MRQIMGLEAEVRAAVRAASGFSTRSRHSSRATPAGGAGQKVAGNWNRTVGTDA